ncbi:MAG: hypothetical protein ACPGLV_11650 [Bacteroidia bacterium]
MQAQKVTNIALRLFVALFILSITLKLQHFNYSNQIMAVILMAILVTYSLRFAYKQHKVLLDLVKLVLVSGWAIQATLAILHWPFRLPFIIITIVAALAWFYLEGPTYFFENERAWNKNGSKLLMFAFSLGVIAIIAGVLFTIMHWPFAGLLLTTGSVVSSLCFLATFIRKK